MRVTPAAQFQSTLPRGERLAAFKARHLFALFQSTLPRGERRIYSNVHQPEGVFQSTLPRGERLYLPCFLIVSINISIHAPARGATLGSWIPFMVAYYFNPRSREGSDIPLSFALKSSLLFQSTLPRGERRNLLSPPMRTILFQSTLPRGERQERITAVILRAAFQSTLPRGERLIGTKVEIDLSTISIHAPARGATFLDNPLCKIKCYFNPRSREGSDLRQNLCPVSQTYFNPRSREGSDAASEEVASWIMISIHAPARGATANITYFFYIKDSYLSNIHKLQYFLTIQI